MLAERIPMVSRIIAVVPATKADDVWAAALSAQRVEEGAIVTADALVEALGGHTITFQERYATGESAAASLEQQMAAGHIVNRVVPDASQEIPAGQSANGPPAIGCSVGDPLAAEAESIAHRRPRRAAAVVGEARWQGDMAGGDAVQGGEIASRGGGGGKAKGRRKVSKKAAGNKKAKSARQWTLEGAKVVGSSQIKSMWRNIAAAARRSERKRAERAGVVMPEPEVPVAVAAMELLAFEQSVLDYCRVHPQADLFARSWIEVLVSLTGYRWEPKEAQPGLSVDRGVQTVLRAWKTLMDKTHTTEDAGGPLTTPEAIKTRLEQLFGATRVDQAGSAAVIEALLLRVGGHLFNLRHGLYSAGRNSRPRTEGVALAQLIASAGTWTVLVVLGASGVKLAALLNQGCRAGLPSDFLAGQMPHVKGLLELSSLSEVARRFQQLHLLRKHVLYPLLFCLGRILPSSVNIHKGAAYVSFEHCLYALCQDRKTYNHLFDPESDPRRHPAWEQGVKVRKQKQTAEYTCPFERLAVKQGDRHQQVPHFRTSKDYYKSAQGDKEFAMGVMVSQDVPNIGTGAVNCRTLPEELYRSDAMLRHDIMTQILRLR
ncbi:hypothetical protein CBOM_05514 [Ceraceosorus bombacis]|uniref:Uncharacterized protein n=1 Tax=Ceraceosorus bombacis TaxID=401625 RepID=A0A0P1BR12_9BASI|nr:hypothetical protein CBOM_05514 [Ceraceosorus bombacis]